jgi:hypothetical protein
LLALREDILLAGEEKYFVRLPAKMPSNGMVLGFIRTAIALSRNIFTAAIREGG